jgi:hypothetical protein
MEEGAALSDIPGISAIAEVSTEAMETVSL